MPFMKLFWRKGLYWSSRLILLFDPFFYAKREFRRHFGRDMDLQNPTNLVEKFYWIEKNEDLSLMTICADKYCVREYVSNKGCSSTLVKLYKKWDSPDEISFDDLPNSFILKINNGSGDVTIVRDKSKANIDEIKKHFQELFDSPYGLYGEKNAQFHYTKIKPCIVAEELLSNNAVFSSSLVDYKIWCFNGKPESIFVAYNRTTDSICMDLFDAQWNNIPEHLNPSHHYQYHPENIIPKPKSLDDMLKFASLLSKGIPEVRVDLYDVNGKVYFGEMTFTSGYGYFKNAYYDHLGELTDLSILSEK